MTHVSLFTGIGGIDLAAHWAGFETVAMVERDPFCQQVLRANFRGVPIYGDVTRFNGREYAGCDLVSAGFPCQPHSVAGSRKASGDERDLWSEVVRVVGEASPRWFLGENVAGLLSSESGRFFARVVDDLDALGYRVGWCMYGAKHVGAPHGRKRVFIVAHANDSRLNGRQQAGWSVGDIRRRNREAKTTNANRQECVNVVRETSENGLPIADAKVMQRDGGKVKSARRKVPKPRDADSQRIFVADAHSESGSQANSGAYPVGNERGAWHDVMRSDWTGIRDRDWERVSVEPVVRGDDDGIPSRLDHEAKLRALGNAVVPQQIYPVLKAMAEAMR